MADSPVKQLHSGVVNIEATIDGSKIPDAMMVLEVEVVKEVNKIPYAKIMIFDGDSREQTFPQSDNAIFEPGGEVEIKVSHDPTKPTNTIYKGILVEHGIRLKKDGMGYLMLTCKDECLKMTVGRRNKVFYKKKDSEIISEIFSGAGVASPEVEATKATHKKLIQYYCTNWDFVQARADANGLVTVINDGKISIKKPAISEKTDILVTYGIDLMEMDIKMDSSFQYEEVEANFWDYTKLKIQNAKGKKPAVNKQGDIDSVKLSKVLSHKELVHTTAPVTKAVIQSWADAVYQRGHLSRIRGRLKFVGSDKIVPGKVVELEAIGTRFNGDGYIGKVRHTIKNGQWLTEVELGLPQRPYLETYPEATPLGAGGGLPAISGLQHGIVKKIADDPDGQYRVLVVIPIIEGDGGEGVWARMSHPYATEDCGFVIYPEIDDEVLLGFFDNDPTYPVILGSLYSSSKKKITTEETHDPAEPNIFKAMSFNKGKMRLEFADDPGKNVIKTITEKKMLTELNDGDEKIVIEDPVNKSTMTMDSKGVTWKIQENLTIDVTGEIKITGKKNIAMEATQDIKGKGLNINLESNANVKIKAGAMGNFEAGGILTLKGAMVKIN